MPDIIINQQAAEMTMTSREIAELTGKRHDNVMADIRKMLVELHGEDRLLRFQETVERPNPSGGAAIQSTLYRLPKRETLVLVSGYNVQMRAKIIDRWQELESAPKADPIQLLNDPAAMRGILLNYTEKVLSLQAKVEEQAPKVAALDRIATFSDGSFCIRDAAKSLQIPERRLQQLMLERQWVYRRPMGAGLLAYSDKLQSGLMEHKITRGERQDGSEWVGTQARVTAKGMAKLATVIAESCLQAA